MSPNMNNPDSNHLDLLPSKNLAYLSGVLKGDGYVGRSKNHGHYLHSIELKTAEKQFADCFYKGLIDIGLTPCIVVGKTKIGRPFCRLVAYSGIFHDFYGSTNLKDLATKDQKVAFLKGFYELEGSVVNRRSTYSFDRRSSQYEVRFCNTGITLPNLCKRMPEGLEFYSYINGPYKWDGYYKKDKRKPVYRLIVGEKETVLELMRMLDPRIKRIGGV